MEQYHGTSQRIAEEISLGTIDVTLGGGELGQGFYTGDQPHEAFNWAWHKHKRLKSVVKFDINDDELLNLNPICLNLHQTYMHRKAIKNLGETRSFRFSTNVIWAPVVGKHVHDFNQFKYESQRAENYLNSVDVIKTVY